MVLACRSKRRRRSGTLRWATPIIHDVMLFHPDAAPPRLHGETVRGVQPLRPRLHAERLADSPSQSGGPMQNERKGPAWSGRSLCRSDASGGWSHGTDLNRRPAVYETAHERPARFVMCQERLRCLVSVQHLPVSSGTCRHVGRQNGGNI